MAPGPLEPYRLAVVPLGSGFLGEVFLAAVAEVLLSAAAEHIPGDLGDHPTKRWQSCLTQKRSSIGRALAHLPQACHHPRVPHLEGLRPAVLMAAYYPWMVGTPGDVLSAEASRAQVGAEVGSAVWLVRRARKSFSETRARLGVTGCQSRSHRIVGRTSGDSMACGAMANSPVSRRGARQQVALRCQTRATCTASQALRSAAPVAVSHGGSWPISRMRPVPSSAPSSSQDTSSSMC